MLPVIYGTFTAPLLSCVRYTDIPPAHTLKLCFLTTTFNPLQILDHRQPARDTHPPGSLAMSLTILSVPTLTLPVSFRLCCVGELMSLPLHANTPSPQIPIIGPLGLLPRAIMHTLGHRPRYVPFADKCSW